MLLLVSLFALAMPPKSVNKSGKLTKEEELLLLESSRNVSTATSALFYGNALIVSIMPLCELLILHLSFAFASSLLSLLIHSSTLSFCSSSSLPPSFTHPVPSYSSLDSSSIRICCLNRIWCFSILHLLTSSFSFFTIQTSG